MIDFLSSNPDARASLKDLARHLGIASREEYHALRELAEDLDRRGVVSTDRRGRISYVRTHGRTPRKPAVQRRLVGALAVTRRGVGMVRDTETGDEIQIPPRYLRTALHGDIVAVVPFARNVAGRGRAEGPREGEVVEVVQRKTTRLTGTVKRSRHFTFVIPDDDRIARDIYVAPADLKKAKEGDKVVVSLHPWTDEHLNPEGSVVEVLGPAGDARVEVLSVSRTFALPREFPREVLRETSHLSSGISRDEIGRRADFRNLPTITIDPDDAQDFDDALSCEQLDGGRLRLGVHIADVGHFVPDGSHCDREAAERGTSVYMVNEVVPMLPERLSNDLCSLRPREDRLAFSVVMEVHPSGKVDRYEIVKSVIHSDRRFTYEEVQHILDRGKGEQVDLCRRLFGLSRALRERRRKNGSIDFDTAEAKFRFDSAGFPTAIVKKERLDSHRLVEECMLLANVTVARHIGAGTSRPLPFLYRVHDLPDPDRLRDLAAFVKQFKFSLDVRSGVSSRALQKLLDDARGSEVENLITEVALRSMAKAVYSEKNIGHYGLGFPYYTHFTSPIRRYPDLVVHRLLQEYGRGPSTKRLESLRKQLPAVAEHSSERERIAQAAERESIRVMQVEYMKRHLGDVFNGVIGGVKNFGFFVEISDLLVEGLVRVRDLADDYYVFNEGHYSLKGRSRGRTFRLGDRVKVRVLAVDSEERTIDLELAG